MTPHEWERRLIEYAISHSMTVKSALRIGSESHTFLALTTDDIPETEGLSWLQLGLVSRSQVPALHNEFVMEACKSLDVSVSLPTVHLNCVLVEDYASDGASDGDELSSLTLLFSITGSNVSNYVAVPPSDTVLLCEGIIACRLTIDRAIGAIIDTINETDRRWHDSDYMTRQLPFGSSAAVITIFYGTPNGLVTESKPEDDVSPSECSSGYTSDESTLESADVEPTYETDSATQLRTAIHDATRLDSSLVLDGIVGVVHGSVSRCHQF